MALNLHAICPPQPCSREARESIVDGPLLIPIRYGMELLDGRSSTGPVITALINPVSIGMPAHMATNLHEVGKSISSSRYLPPHSRRCPTNTGVSHFNSTHFLRSGCFLSIQPCSGNPNQSIESIAVNIRSRPTRRWRLTTDHCCHPVCCRASNIQPFRCRESFIFRTPKIK